MKTCVCGLLNLLCLIASSSTAIIRSPDNHDDVEKETIFRDTARSLIHRPTSETQLNEHPRRLYFTAYSCERSSLRLTCPPAMTIIPVHATYGRTNMHQCVEGQVDRDEWQDSCSASPRHTRRRIVQHCGMMSDSSQCIIPVFNEFFGRDPCPKTYKYLEVYYACD